MFNIDFLYQKQCKPVEPEPEFINTDDVEREVDMMISLCNAEEEVERLKHYLRLSQEEIYFARAQGHDLHERLQEVEQDRFRLVQRVNGLFSKSLPLQLTHNCFIAVFICQLKCNLNFKFY